MTGEKGVRGWGEAEVKNSSHKHSACDTLVSSAYIKARKGAARGRNLTPPRLTSAPLEMAAATAAAGKAFVTLFDSVFTEIAFTYVSRTKIKQIRKCSPALPAAVRCDQPSPRPCDDFMRTLLPISLPISPDPKVSKYFQAVNCYYYY